VFYRVANLSIEKGCIIKNFGEANFSDFKQTSALCATNGERNMSNRLWICLLQQLRLEHFEIISSVSIST